MKLLWLLVVACFVFVQISHVTAQFDNVDEQLENIESTLQTSNDLVQSYAPESPTLAPSMIEAYEAVENDPASAMADGPVAPPAPAPAAAAASPAPPGEGASADGASPKPKKAKAASPSSAAGALPEMKIPDALKGLPSLGSLEKKTERARDSLLFGAPSDPTSANHVKNQLEKAQDLRNTVQTELTREKEWAQTIQDIISNYQFKYSKVLTDIKVKNTQLKKLQTLLVNLKKANLHETLQKDLNKANMALNLLSGDNADGKQYMAIKQKMDELHKALNQLAPSTVGKAVKGVTNKLIDAVDPFVPPSSTDALEYLLSQQDSKKSAKPAQAAAKPAAAKPAAAPAAKPTKKF